MGNHPAARAGFLFANQEGYTQCKPRKIIKRLSQLGSPRPWQLKWRKKQQKRCCPLAATLGDFWPQPSEGNTVLLPEHWEDELRA